MPLVRTSYIPNGVDTKKFKPEGSFYKSNLDKPIVLCVGELIPSKRIDLAIRAVAKLNGVSLLVVGGGDYNDDIKSLGEKLLGKRFKLTQTSYDKMQEVYRSADVFTLPSGSDYAFEIVFVEAMSSGLAVVANKDSIRKEIVGSAGYLVDPTDVNEYSRLLKKALSKNWGEVPRNQAKKFDWDDIARKYEQLFEQLIK